jgi:hypothetical protein
VDLDEHLVRLHLAEDDIAQFKPAVELGHDERGRNAGHGVLAAEKASCIKIAMFVN